MSSVSSCRPCARTSPKRVECAGTAPVKKMRVRLRVLRAPAGKTQCAPSVGEVPLWWYEEGEGEEEEEDGLLVDGQEIGPGHVVRQEH